MSKGGSDLFKYTAGANAALVQELVKNGEKCTPDNIVGITKDPTGKIVWMETGDDRAGLKHIYHHANDFVKQGVSKEEISTYILEAVHQGNIVGYQRTRTIYESIYEGVKRRVAVNVGSNGFIVGANPKSMKEDKS